MPLVTGQATIGTVSTVLFYMPPGPAVVTINSGTVSASTAYVAVGSGAASTSNGYILDPGRAITYATYVKSPGGTVNAVAGATATTLSWIVSSPA
jgi:hypothetical protein